MNLSKLKRVINFANHKNVDVDTVINACENGDLNYTLIDGYHFIFDDEESRNWSGKVEASFKVKEKKGNIIVFIMKKPLSFYNKTSIENKVLAYAKEEKTKYIFIFDKGCDRIDSAGISILVRTALISIPQKNRIQLINVNQNIKKNLKLAKLESFIDYPKNEKEAIQNLLSSFE